MELHVNTAQLDRFDHFFATHYRAMLDEVATSDPAGAVGRTRAGFASAYRFWGKVEDDGDPLGWVRRVIEEQRRGSAPGADPDSTDETATRAELDMNAERRRVISLARRQRVVARAVLGAGAIIAIAAELFVAHR
jgi:hypothetical protein